MNWLVLRVPRSMFQNEDAILSYVTGMGNSMMKKTRPYYGDRVFCSVSDAGNHTFGSLPNLGQGYAARAVDLR